MSDLILKQQTMTSLDISELLGSRHDKVKQSIERLAERGVIELPPTGIIPTQTKPMNVFEFSCEQGKRDSIIVVAQLSPEFTALIVDRWKELEDKLSKPQLPETYLEALKALVISEEEKILITHERDEAIRTKAMIGSKREATAMAKASAEVKKVKALEIKLDQSNEYATLKRMEIYYKRSFAWRLLKKASIELGKPMMKAQDENYGEVNSYHNDVWKHVYNLEIK